MRIPNTIADVAVGPLAVEVREVLTTLRDVDAQRIAKTDEVVIRKGVLALLEVVGRLEERIALVERSGVGTS